MYLSPHDIRAEIKTMRNGLEFLKQYLNVLRLELLILKSGFDPNQPRVPAGNPDGGQWTDTGGSSSSGSSSGSSTTGTVNQPPPLPRRKPKPVDAAPKLHHPPRPQYRNGDRTVSPVSSRDWNIFNNGLDKRPGTSEREKHTYQNIFAAEGGFTPDTHANPPAVSGITQKTLSVAKTNPNLKDKLSNIKTPLDLRDRSDLVADIYQDYLDKNFKEIGGSAGLANIKNQYAATAMADTVFREGRPQGAKIMRDAIRGIDPGIAADLDSLNGHIIVGQTYKEFSEYANDPATVNLLLDHLGEARKRHRINRNKNPEKNRADFFKFEEDRNK